ncbi:hypothetical protein MKW98_032010 [Papaver atlanticum]|uniref:acireductone dioxygenase (Fe(2+)-requiring) n=1 Tax=Papaver atlanticum TaxID=357466 RepID=A0AAD4SGZ3_9MAGN|nr:hypothetical protein MKW98_032010 [Papaver atlanticum]
MKTRGMGAGRKLKSHHRRQRWDDKSYKKSHLGNVWKKPFAGSSHAKGIVLEKIGIRKCARVQLIKNGKKIVAFVPNDGCLNYIEENIKNFFEEHLHTDEEIRYCVDRSGYFDVRDENKKWIRVWVKNGGIIILSAGMYHRFTHDSDNYIKEIGFFPLETSLECMVKFSAYFLVAVSPANRIKGYIFLVVRSHSGRKLMLSSSYGRIGNKEHNSKRG